VLLPEAVGPARTRKSGDDPELAAEGEEEAVTWDTGRKGKRGNVKQGERPAGASEEVLGLADFGATSVSRRDKREQRAITHKHHPEDTAARRATKEPFDKIAQPVGHRPQIQRECDREVHETH